MLGGSQLLNLRTGVFPVLSYDGDRMFHIHSITGDLIAIDTPHGRGARRHPAPARASTSARTASAVGHLHDRRRAVAPRCSTARSSSYDPVTLAPHSSASPSRRATPSAFVLDDGEGGLLISGYLRIRTHRRSRPAPCCGSAPQTVCAEAELTGSGHDALQRRQRARSSSERDRDRARRPGANTPISRTGRRAPSSFPDRASS